MMRLLFGFLLLLSIVLFVLMQWGDALTGAGKNGQMLAELNPDKIVLLDRPLSSPLAVSEAQPALSGVAASAPAASAPQAAGASEPVAVSAPAALPATEPVAAVVPAPSPPAVVVPPAVSAPAHVSAPVVVAPVKAPIATCMEWGEFSGVDLDKVTQLLSKPNLGESLARRTVEYSSGYWVYMPPLKNKAAVNRKISQLRDLGVNDYYVVHEPPRMVNVISLGVFKTREAAANFLSSLKKKGVRSAKMGERKQKLKFTVFQLKQVDTGLAARLAALQKEFAYSELKRVECNGESKRVD